MSDKALGDNGNNPKLRSGGFTKVTQQFLIVAVVETSDEVLAHSQVSMSSFIERVLMLNSGVDDKGNRLISRVKVIAGDHKGEPVIAWGENDEKVFTANPILPAVGYNT